VDFITEIQAPQFWTGLLAIIWVNVVLSGDNAVVIALAARSLPKHQQGKAVFWGAGAAVLLRIILTIVAVELLKWPFLKIVGGLLLFWIAIKLLLPEDDDTDVESSANLLAAIKTILIADLVMSLDNVIAVAAVAQDSRLLLVLGLAISIPLVIFGATLLMKMMERYPIIITIGAALLGWVAGGMLVTDPFLAQWIDANVTWLHIDLPEVSAIEIIGAVLVVVLGKWLATRTERRREKVADLAMEQRATTRPATESQSMLKVLVPVDGSANSDRAVSFLIREVPFFAEALDVHLLNVRHAFNSTIRGVHDQAQQLHQEEGLHALASARKLLDEAGMKYNCHISVGEPAEVIAHYVKDKDIQQIVMGTSGLGAMAGLLLGSVATKVIHLSSVPVLLVK